MDPIFNKINDINEVSKSLKKSSLSLTNRLQSILYDYYYVSNLHETILPNFPLVGNERCGLWYVPKTSAEASAQRIESPTTNYLDHIFKSKSTTSAVFKSTDGHTNVWSFSLRRLNLQLLPLLSEFGGLSIIDSTRRGKLMPDALSKTIPIWCAVINSILYDGMDQISIKEELENDGADEDEIEFLLDLMKDNWLRTPKSMVSENEHNSIVKLISSFRDSVYSAGLFDRETLLEMLGGKRKPLVPSWFYPGKGTPLATDSMYQVCCISASKKVESSYEMFSIRTMDDTFLNWNYIQGSGDDHELWVPTDLCKGSFGPNLFWKAILDKNSNIIDCNTGFIYSWMTDIELFEKLNTWYDSRESRYESNIALHQLAGTGICIGKIDSTMDYKQVIGSTSNPTIVVFSEKYKIANIPPTKVNNVLEYPIAANKKGSNILRSKLPEIGSSIDFESSGSSCIILCETGRDISIGFALVLLCKFFDSDWERTSESSRISKTLVKQHLSKLSQITNANPSRSTLQSINAYLFSHQ
ncbi:RIT1 [[Candida] subhashii]|uniref:RIT1 n=1 Tax=[Candida] subhashii TaxID=561895 RepID=A0A8J5Q6Y3_9ASCO|nr:RIT1 [[Candida] subhashii]KAG7661251.1 RIT1 [[Candida] subhashii]